MNKENKVNFDFIWNKYQSVWQELYQEYIYAFNDYEEYRLTIKKYIKLDIIASKDENINKNYFFNNGKSIINDIIYKDLINDKLDYILKYIDYNIEKDNDVIQELTKIIKWLKSFNYTPSPNVIINLIEQSQIFRNMLQKLVTSSLDKIKRKGVENVFDNELIALFVEIYCSLNNIDLEIQENALENDINIPEEEKESINDILREQQNIMPTYEEESVEYEQPSLITNRSQDESLKDYMPTGADAFLFEIRRKNLKVFTKEQEYELLVKIKNGDKEAYKFFYENNCRLVISIAKKYRNLRIDYEDLLQEGCIGLMTAIDRFEIERNLKFSTYATWWIKQAILRAVNKYGRTVGISINRNDSLPRYRKKVESLADKLGRKPTDEEIAKHLDMALSEVKENNQLLLPNISINQKVLVDESEVGDFLSDDSVQIEDDFIAKNLATELQLLFKRAGLTEKEIIILSKSWGIK